MKGMDAEIYIAEALELLDELEAGLLELEERPEDRELVNGIFRALHTIKGSGKMFGFDEVAAFVHDIETTFDRVRGGKLAAGQELVSLTLASCDIIRRMVGGEAVETSQRDDFLARFRLIQDGRSGASAPPAETATGMANDPEVYRIRFQPGPELLDAGTDLDPVFRELKEMGECTVICHSEASDRAPLWDIVLTTARDERAIRDVFIFVEAESLLEITSLSTEMVGEPRETHRLLGEILVEKGDLTREHLAGFLARKPLFGELLVQEKMVPQSSVAAALAEQQHVRELPQAQSGKTGTGSVRVAAEKLDTLVDLVGELVIVQARLSRHSLITHDPAAVLIAEELERLTVELRDNTMSLRMVPIGTTLGKFRRLVRDLSKELGKEVELVMEGGETELDKTVIERLNDPLVHLLRNSLDHGIESPEERRARGKQALGTIRLAAAHLGANVVITVADDGGGLDARRIRDKAVANGLIDPDAEMSEEEILQLIFEPGFSTAAKVSDVSGRGVGMDVVRRGVESLRGVIEVTSEPGRRTTMVIRLPLTMAIIEGLLVEAGGEMYVIPEAAVVECFEQTREDIARSHGNDVINVRGHMRPYICLRKRFGIDGEIPPSRRVVLCEANGRMIGLAVDRVIGSHQTVIKPLGELSASVPCISGATILGDGTVALILDPGKLIMEGQP